jgi:galactokinase
MPEPVTRKADGAPGGWLPRAIGPPASQSELQDIHVTKSRLEQNGLTADASERIAATVARCASIIARGSNRDGHVVSFFCPGRIEVLGKHTDYAGGRSLICTVDRGFALVARPRMDRRIVVRDALLHQQCDLILDPELPASPGHWSDYVRTVVRRIAQNFDHGTGADIVLESDLPPAAGLSSSSALVIGTFLAIAGCRGLDDDPDYASTIDGPETLAGYLAAVENGLDFETLGGGRGVGTMGGSQDHTALLCAQPGALVRYSFAPVRAEGAVPLPGDVAFVIASSGVRAEKSAAALLRYNRLAELARDAAAVWRNVTGRSEPHLGAILETGGGDSLLNALRTSDHPDAPDRLARAEQFLEEAGTIIPSAFDALVRNDLVSFGELVARSHHLAESKLRNQIPETITLAQLARVAGAFAVSAFGAGFGGSVWALVPEAIARSFSDDWQRAYTERFPQHREGASFFITKAGPATIRLT